MTLEMLRLRHASTGHNMICQTSQVGLQAGWNMTSHSASSTSTVSSPYDPCVDVEVEKYLNLPAVQKALHTHGLPYRWTGCT